MRQLMAFNHSSPVTLTRMELEKADGFISHPSVQHIYNILRDEVTVWESGRSYLTIRVPSVQSTLIVPTLT